MIDEKALLEAVRSGEYECEIEAPAAHAKTIQEVAGAFNKMIVKIILDQPLIDEWKPCIEGLPEVVKEHTNAMEIDPYLITIKSLYGDIITAPDLAIYVKNRGWVWFDETIDIDQMEDVAVEVVAWKELPRPYKREGESK